MIGALPVRALNARSTSKPNEKSSVSETVFRCASEEETLESAFRLVYTSYLRAGLIEPDALEMRVIREQLRPGSQVLVAERDGTVITTMSMVRGEEGAIPLESIFPREVRQQRDLGVSYAEVVSLADRRRDLRRTFAALRPLMSLMAQYATHHSIDRLLIAVHPRHVSFYGRFLGFTPISGEAIYPSVLNHPAIAMMLDLPNLAEHHPVGYRRLFGTLIDAHALRRRPLEDAVRRRFCEIADSLARRAPQGGQEDSCDAARAMSRCA